VSSVAIAVWLLAALAQAKPGAPKPARPFAEELARAVDLPNAADRRAAALALAARDDVPLDTWLEEARKFGAFEESEPGVRVETADLWEGAKSVPTEIHVYVPPGVRAAKPAPLMLMFHGTGGSGAEMHQLWKKLADDLGMIVVSPSEAGPNEGYAFSERERQSSMSALRWARRKFNVDERRIFAAGISRGGHLVWDLALRDRDRFAAVAPMIGGPRLVIGGGQNNLRFIHNILDLPIRDLQGSKDDPKLVADVRYAFTRLKSLGAKDAQLTEFPDLGHWFDFTAVSWKELLENAARDPIPKRVVRACCRLDEARAWWVQVLGVSQNVSDEFTPQITQAQWNALGDDGKRRWMNEEAEKRTARLDVTMEKPGRFVAKGTGVTSFRVLLADGMWDPPAPAFVEFGGKSTKRVLKREKRVLALDFVERFDRTFLPVAEIVVQ